MHALHTLAILTLPALAAGQIPPRSILLGESASTVNTSLVSVDTAGKATVLTGHGRDTHTSVALDPADPRAVWSLGAWPTIGTAPVGHYILSGYSAATTGSGDGLVGTFGRVERCHRMGDQLLITFSSVTPGLYRRALTGGNATLVAGIANAFDIAVLQGKVYVTTTGTPSTLVEVDMSTAPAKTRVVAIKPTQGSAPTQFAAIATYGWDDDARQLLIGASNGAIWFVDPNTTATTNAFSPQVTNAPPAVAIATHPDAATDVVIATANGLYNLLQYFVAGTPFYTTTNTIQDMAVLGGGSVTFGQGCAGSKGEPLHTQTTRGWAYNGNAGFSLDMRNGPPSSFGTLVFGLTSTPLDLTVIGAPGCFLYPTIAIRLGVLTDASGAIQIPAPIPSNPSLVGTRIYTQWGLFESAANPAGVITTKGLSITIR